METYYLISHKDDEDDITILTFVLSTEVDKFGKDMLTDEDFNYVGSGYPRDLVDLLFYKCNLFGITIRRIMSLNDWDCDINTLMDMAEEQSINHEQLFNSNKYLHVGNFYDKNDTNYYVLNNFYNKYVISVVNSLNHEKTMCGGTDVIYYMQDSIPDKEFDKVIDFLHGVNPNKYRRITRLGIPSGEPYDLEDVRVLNLSDKIHDCVFYCQ